MKKVAIVGFGFMGRTHLGAWRKVRGAKVVALCDANLAQLSNKVSGNGRNADMTTDFSDLTVYDDFDRMLASGGFDIVDITVPTPLHPTLSVKALAAGLNVLCEKPLAVDAKTCDGILAAARKARGRFMVAQALRFSPVMAYLHDLIASKKYGEVVSATFDRVSMAPGWGAGGKSWFLNEKASGGLILDMHIHDADFIHWTLGLPKAVTVYRHVRGDGVTDHTTTLYDYGNRVVKSDAGWASAPSFVFEARAYVELEKATVVLDEKRAQPLTVYPFEGKAFQPKIDYKATCYEREVQAFCDYVCGRKRSLPVTPEEVRASVALVDAERRSMMTGRKVRLGA